MTAARCKPWSVNRSFNRWSAWSAWGSVALTGFVALTHRTVAADRSMRHAYGQWVLRGCLMMLSLVGPGLGSAFFGV